ncbi:MAG: hypothetical protein ABW277_25815 [Longimicrobiaceae bacterium]
MTERTATQARCRRVAGPALGAAICLLYSTQLHAQGNAGYVGSINGRWYAGPDPLKQLSVGQVIRNGTTIVAGSNSPQNHYITVVLSNGKHMTLNCELEDCRRPRRVEVGSDIPARVIQIWTAVSERFRSRPDAYVPLISRGSPYRLQEGVVGRDSAGIDLASPFADMPAGRYTVRMVRVGEGGRCDDPDMLQAGWTGSFEWRRGGMLQVGPDDVGEGIYLLCVPRRVREHIEAWVLVVDRGSYSRAAEAFNEAVRLAQSWDGIDSEYDSRAFLRAYLHDLAVNGIP